MKFYDSCIIKAYRLTLKMKIKYILIEICSKLKSVLKTKKNV